MDWSIVVVPVVLGFFALIGFIYRTDRKYEVEEIRARKRTIFERPVEGGPDAEEE